MFRMNYFILFPLAIGVMFVFSNLRRFSQRTRLRRVGREGTATVIEVAAQRLTDSTSYHEHEDGWARIHRFLRERRYTYTLMYEVEGSTYTHRLQNEGTEQRYRMGDTIDIVYNPANPKDMMLAGGLRNMSFHEIGVNAFIGLGILMMIIMYLLR